jgi:gliding motility-associated-like protein
VSVIAAATDTICEGATKPFSLTISASTASPWTVIYKEIMLKTGAGSQTTLPGVNAPSSTVNVTPSITSAILDSAAFSYTVVSVKDNNGCSSTSMTGSRKLVVFNGLDNNSGFSAGTYNGICGPTVQLTGKKNFGTMLWTYDPVITPASPQTVDNVTVTVPLAATTPDVTYRFFWSVLNGKCQGKDSVDLTFYQVPGPVSAQPDTTLLSFDGTFILTSTAPTLGTGTWYSDQSGTAIPGGVLTGLESDVTYKYKWLVTNGACRDSVYTNVTVRKYKIPNAFSPNNDTWNDVFEIEGLDTIKTYITFTVFTSAGTRVYSTSNENGSYVPWNGNNEKGVPVPDGTYYYVMTLRSKQNTRLQKYSGFIVVKRDTGSG